jgi:uncharacterized protein YbbK (DUF523 family)
VSSCLLGNEVRYDGGHKLDRVIIDELGALFEWVPVCPEVEAGLGTPRAPMRLRCSGGAVRMVETMSGRDRTDAVRRCAERRIWELGKLDLRGFVLKKDSPSCGRTGVRVDADEGASRRDARGLFAEALAQAFPRLPVEDEGRLDDARLRENFIERVFAYRRLCDCFSGRWTNQRVVEFHAAQRPQLMARGVECCRRLDELVSDVDRVPRVEFRERYEGGFMEALASRLP